MNFEIANYTPTDKIIYSLLTELATASNINYPVKVLSPEYIEIFNTPESIFQLNITGNASFNSGESVQFINRKTKRKSVREIDFRSKACRKLVKNYAMIYRNKLNQIYEFLIPKLTEKIMTCNFAFSLWRTHFYNLKDFEKTNLFPFPIEKIQLRSNYEMFIEFTGFNPKPLSDSIGSIQLDVDISNVILNYQLELTLMEDKKEDIENLLRRVLIKPCN